MKGLLELFISFFKIGGLTFGGGYAMMPILQKEAIDKHGWATHEEIMDYYAVAQCLPGIIAVNTAILVGYKVRKKAGGIAAAVGVVVPSLLIIMLIAAFLQNVLDYETVRKAFWGIRIVVSALILQAIVSMWKSAMKSVSSYILYAAAFALSWFTQIPTMAVVAAAIAVGVIQGMVMHGRKGRGKV